MRCNWLRKWKMKFSSASQCLFVNEIRIPPKCAGRWIAPTNLQPRTRQFYERSTVVEKGDNLRMKVENILGPSRLIVWKSLNSLCGWGMLGLEKKKTLKRLAIIYWACTSAKYEMVKGRRTVLCSLKRQSNRQPFVLVCKSRTPPLR